MSSLINNLYSESKKQKHSFFQWISVIIPVGVSTILAAYFKIRSDVFNFHTAYLIFFEVIAMGTPLIVSIICGLLISQEKNAGEFKNILGISKNKEIPIMSKTLFMILSYTASLIVAAGIYFFLLKFWVGYDVQFLSIFLNVINYSLSVVFLYFFYSLLSYTVGSGITSIFGIGGLVITALSFTALGDRIWFYLPWAWSHRFSLFIYAHLSKLETLTSYSSYSSFFIGILFFISLNTALIVFFKSWAKKWEGT